MKNNRNFSRLIRQVVKTAAAKIAPQKVILFGSYAYGRPNQDSDVDLLFIKNTKLKGAKRYLWFSNRIERNFPMDLIIRTPKELKKRLTMGDPFYKEIINKGKVLYDSSK